MSSPDEAHACALLGAPVTLLGSGAEVVAYTDGERVVRLARPGRPGRFEVDAAIRRALRARGVPTPEPLATGTLPDGRPYGVDTLAQGDDSGPSAEGWRDLGRALEVLHALPHTGFGLLEDRSDLLSGLAPTPEDGLRSRLPDAWPLGPAGLSDQPLVRAAPDLEAPLLRVRDDLAGVIRAPTALCHTDLHGGQFRWKEGRLAALLDFGDASAVPAAWDVASLAFFHGWEAAERTGLSCGRDAALFGLWLAQHRARRAGERPDRLAAAVTFARECLDRL